MRKVIGLLAALVYFGSLGCQLDNRKASRPEEAGKPNIVYVLADQWRAQATGYNGDPNLSGKTPNLDRLAAHAVNFKNAISVTPVCTPYRAALLTGQYPTTTGMIFNDLHLPEESITMAELFKASGYKTGYIGKWHLDGMGRFAYTPPERRQGFDYWKALECSHEYTDLVYYEGDNKEKKHWEGYGPYAETQDAISYIQQHAESGHPFLLVLAWGSPHFPYHNTPDEMQQQFDPEDIILRENVTEEQRDEAKKQSAGYYAHILGLDKCIGQLQQAIEKGGITENTIFVFTSDHGEMMGSHGVRPRQKQVPWAESVRVPFLLRYPAKYKDKIEVEAPINTPDILPTLLSMADLPIPGFIEGEDMSEAIDHEEAGRRKAALIMNVSPFADKGEAYRGIYTSRYAYVKTGDGPWLLFDNVKDPLQMNNLLNQPGYEQLQHEMERVLQQELKKVGDEFRPREYYIDKWGYELTEGGYIDYSEGAPFQGPGLNK
ncbi:MAG: sulfatase [Saprospiraceae bacterium]